MYAQRSHVFSSIRRHQIGTLMVMMIDVLFFLLFLFLFLLSSYYFLLFSTYIFLQTPHSINVVSILLILRSL